MIRLFVGIALPKPIRDRLAGLQNGVPGARWVEPDNLHITLRFIGEVDEDVAEDIDEHLTTIAAPAFDLSIGGLGRFGDRRGARILWVGVEPQPALVHLRDKVESACVRAGLEPDGRKYRPHVTLARFRDPGGQRVDQVVAANTDWQAGTFRARSFILFSSHLGRSGAHYRAEAEYPLHDGPDEG